MSMDGCSIDISAPPAAGSLCLSKTRAGIILAYMFYGPGFGHVNHTQGFPFVGFEESDMIPTGLRPGIHKASIGQLQHCHRELSPLLLQCPG